MTSLEKLYSIASECDKSQWTRYLGSTLIGIADSIKWQNDEYEDTIRTYDCQKIRLCSKLGLTSDSSWNDIMNKIDGLLDDTHESENSTDDSYSELMECFANGDSINDHFPFSDKEIYAAARMFAVQK